MTETEEPVEPTESTKPVRRRNRGVRGHVSMKSETYSKLKMLAKQRKKSICKMVEEWIEQSLDKAGAP